MRKVFLCLVVVLMFGCGSSGITLYRMVDGEPEPIAEVKQMFGGKGCVAVDSTPEGTSVIVQQAGTSDWAITRALAFIGDIAGGVFGGNKTTNEMQGPTASMQGCEGVFESTPEVTYDNIKPDVLYRADPVEPVE